MIKYYILLICLLFFLFSGCGKKEPPAEPTATPKPASIHSLDAGRRTAVEVALKNDIELASMNIKVEAVNYTVILKGEVDTEDQRERAEEIALSVKGVSKVENNLTVAP